MNLNLELRLSNSLQPEDRPQVPAASAAGACGMVFKFPEELPICAHRAEIEKAIRENQVVIICGDTGSGKTTQLPKMALELGRGTAGRIACTQPRRLAAVTVARRVAEEFGKPVGDFIGYQHRFEKKVSKNTRVKFMTDGVLLAETRADPLLRAYDTIIIDEAHERSLNIDFLLGIIRRILTRRKDLKLIVSSATLDAELFSAFFGNAPALKVPGRLFPIAIEYAPPPEDEEADVARDVRNAVDALPPTGDILVFLPGEHDIRETADLLTQAFGERDDIIPLMASLPASEQQRAFRTSAKRRIILATNVAETSVTIPGIRYVIDSGLARISRYIHRTQVQRLQIEPVSRAAANQRAGRCGRLGPGICIRLYSEEDFNRRDEYTPPEILRSSLAGVILTMLDLRLGNIAEFPFLNPPEPAMIREGMRELFELGAITSAGPAPAGLATPQTTSVRLTPIGWQLAKIPVEPRLARMLLAASSEGVLPSVIPLVAAMACDDPKRRPIDDREKADQAHAKFKAPDSDFACTLKLWRWWEEQTRNASQNQARKLCKATYLSYPKMREWRDLAAQLESLSKRLGLRTDSDKGDNAAIHKALLSGLLGRIGVFDTEHRDYRGARGIRFAIHPGSVLYRKPKPQEHPAPETKPDSKRPAATSAQWIMAGELVDTSRLYAREAAILDPKWLEPIAGDLCRHSYNSPEWDAEHGFVRATEQVTLYGLVIVHARRCDFSRIDPETSRSIFIRHGLVGGAFPKQPPEVRNNIALIESIRKRAEKTRNPDLLDEDKLFTYYDSVIPREICSCDALRKWLRRATPEELAAFRLKADDWISPDDASGSGFPDSITIGKAKMALVYRHSLNDDEDGITCTVRKSDAPALREWRADWLVPGALPEKLSWMISCLPSAQRRILSPIEDTVSRLMTYLRPGQETLKDAVCRTIHEQWGIKIYPDAWDGIRMPPYFSVRFRVKDDGTGRVIASGRDLEEVLSRCGITQSAAKLEKTAFRDNEKHTTWDFGPLAAEQSAGRAGWEIKQYPALRDEGDAVSVQLYTDPVKAQSVHKSGLARLFVLALGKTAKAYLRFRQFPVQATLFLRNAGYEDAKIADDFLMAIVTEAFIRGQDDIRAKADFDARLKSRMTALSEAQADLAQLYFDIVTAAAERNRTLLTDERLSEATQSAVKNQLAWLVFPGFLRHVPMDRLRHYTRYLEGIRIRLERARLGASTDAEREMLVAPFWNRYREAVTAKKPLKYNAAALADYRWMVEEYRISVFAQNLRTPTPVSPKRLDAQWELATK